MGRKIDAEVLEAEKKPFLTRIERVKRIYNFEAPCLITSPMKRCCQTAGLIGNEIKFKQDMVVEPDFTETDMGEFSSKRGRDLRVEYGSLVDEWMYRPETFRFPGGESYSEVKKRVGEGLEGIVKRCQDRSEIILVSHVDILKMILSKALDFPFNNRRYLTIPPGSISVIGILNNEKMQVRRIDI